MPDMYCDAVLFQSISGIDIYHVHKNDHIEGFVRDYLYSLIPDSRDCGGEEYQCFDVRDLPSWTDVGYDEDKIAEILRLAIDRGELDELIDQAEADGYIIR